ncbi:MAG TPA: alpha/beta hydrolase [Nitrososphaerales archaeon]|nr:alpha/beta hydrolase [Nitrososphaerales archaeon]
MPKFRSNGAELYYAVDGEGLPIVLLHCLPMDHRIWMNQFFELTSKYKVIGLDFRGLGHSEGGSTPCSIATLSDDVNNLFEVEGISKAVVAGISLGGQVAQQFALDHPEKLAGVVLSGTNCNCTTERLQKQFTERVAKYRSSEAESYYAGHLEGLFSPEFLASPRAKSVMKSYISAGTRKKFDSIANLFLALLQFNVESQIGRVRTPLLVIAGDKDRAFQDSKNIADRVSGSTFFPVSGAGHAVCMETPTEFNQAFASFLAKISYQV